MAGTEDSPGLSVSDGNEGRDDTLRREWRID